MCSFDITKGDNRLIVDKNDNDLNEKKKVNCLCFKLNKNINLRMIVNFIPHLDPINIFCVGFGFSRIKFCRGLSFNC